MRPRRGAAGHIPRLEACAGAPPTSCRLDAPETEAVQQQGFPERPWTLVSHHLASTSLGTTFLTDTPIRCLDLSPFLRLECAFSRPA